MNDMALDISKTKIEDALHSIAQVENGKLKFFRNYRSIMTYKGYTDLQKKVAKEAILAYNELGKRYIVELIMPVDTPNEYYFE